MTNENPHRIPHWSAHLSVGNAELDEQHITLLETGRELVSMLQTPTSRDDDLRAVLHEIILLAEKHNHTEESILAANQCPSWEHHCQEHQSSCAELARLHTLFPYDPTRRRELIEAITDWMGRHLSETDLMVRDYMKTK